MKDLIEKRFAEAAQVQSQACRHLSGRIVQAVDLIVASYRAGGGVFLFGNGGSAADAQHIAGELVGRFMKERKALRAQALTADSSVLTCLANDYNFDRIFARQIEANARAGDVAVGISTSGNSPNVVAALSLARSMGLKTIALTGQSGGKCAALADVLLDVPSACTPRIQEAHAVIYHTICELVEAAMA
ncbi:MAG: D-sedoheptulose 7-phosphate isomerase [Planctomycetes bacterium]|nr:D-sedoheptulose 7-phosphate isomerase [Planctomycetota bacterium]